MFIKDVFIPDCNRRFARKPEQEGSAFVAIPGVDLRETLCVQAERRVGNDNCVSFNRLKLQIPESLLRPQLRVAKRQASPVPRRHPRHLPRAKMPGPVRQKGSNRGRKKAARIRSAAEEQNHKHRTNDVRPIPDKLISYRHPRDPVRKRKKGSIRVICAMESQIKSLMPGFSRSSESGRKPFGKQFNRS